MLKRIIPVMLAAAAAAVLYSPFTSAQTLGEPEEFTAIAIKNDEFGSGAGTVLMRVTRWSTDAERQKLLDTLREKGPEKLLDELSKMRSVGSIRTPDSLAYDLRYAHERKAPDGGRQIVLATDRPIGFWEARNQPRTINYPFTVIQMQMGPEGRGKGTLSLATRIVARDEDIILENFSTAPIMLNEIKSQKLNKGE